MKNESADLMQKERNILSEKFLSYMNEKTFLNNNDKKKKSAVLEDLNRWYGT